MTQVVEVGSIDLRYEGYRMRNPAQEGRPDSVPPLRRQNVRNRS